MSEFIKWLTSFQVSFSFSANVGDIVMLMFVGVIIWFFIMAHELSKAYMIEHPGTKVDDWISSVYGMTFIKVVCIPLIPLMALIGIISIPMVFVYDRLKNRK